jgi:Cof subfamily protein (haloacid dehalogenase superfamily)
VDIRLVVVDVDGTIAGKSNDVTEPIRKAIASVQAKGIPVAIATGRMYQSALRFHKRIKSSQPLIAYNGAWIQNPRDGRLHRHIPVPADLALDLVEYLRQPQWKPYLGVHLYIDDALYVSYVNNDTVSYGKRSGIKPIIVEDLRTVIHKHPTKILAMGHDSAIIKQLWETLSARYTPEQLYLTQSTETFFEATHPEATKGEAVAYLAEKVLGLNRDQVMTIGDNFNDVSMLSYAGLAIAMGDAPEDVKSLAHWVAPSVESDGVAAALEKFIP